MTTESEYFITELRIGTQTHLIENIDLWHLTQSNDLLSNNTFLSKGISYSISYINQMENLGNAVSSYGLEAMHHNKEQAWEEVRKKYFTDLPSRINAMFFFESKDDADRALQEWFPDQHRLVVRAQPLVGCRRFRADARWLDNVTPENIRIRAQEYWEGKITTDPRIEIVIHGQVYFPEWQTWTRLMSPTL